MVFSTIVLLLATAIIQVDAPGEVGSSRPRARALGLTPGILEPGPRNAITDVAGVRVGHKTIIRGDSIRTGVTAIVPHAGNLFQQKVVAAVFPGNAFGKAAGFLQVRELGRLETPIILTNTLDVGTAVEAVVAWTLARPGNEAVRSVNAVVGETNDGYLNDIRAQAVRSADVIEAIESARGGPVAEGSVGAGIGTRAFGWKGGIGTASRRLPTSLGGYTVGALVQSNFGGILMMDGLPVGEALGRYPYREQIEADRRARGNDEAGGEAAGVAPLRRAAREPTDFPGAGDPGDGSCMIVLATDAPLSSRNLERLARRAVLGLARTGSTMSNGSGDFVIAFSTAHLVPHAPGERTMTRTLLHNDAMSPLFLAVVEAVEESVLNSLTRATTVQGYRGRRVEALPLEEIRKMISQGTRNRPAPAGADHSAFLK